jgi:hypothetical protein
MTVLVAVTIAITTFFYLTNEGKQSHETGAFDSAGQAALVLGTRAGYATRQNFTVLTQELFKSFVFVINVFDAPLVKLRDFVTATTTESTATASAFSTALTTTAAGATTRSTWTRWAAFATAFTTGATGSRAAFATLALRC